MSAKQKFTQKLRTFISSSIKGKSHHAFNKSPLLRVFINFNFLTQSLLFIILLFSFLAFIGSKPSFAQSLMDLEQTGIPPSMNPVGSGARALGMGGAFIAVADDATAASWNPGGLIQLETPEVSIVGSYFDSTEDLTFENNSEASGSQNTTNTGLNYLSAAFPFTLFNRNMIVSANYQNGWDFSRDWKIPLTLYGSRYADNQNFDIQLEGSLYAIMLAYCVQVTPKLSFGFTLNFWEDGLYENAWEINTTQTGVGIDGFGDVFTYEIDNSDTRSFRGFNSNLGILWNINTNITLGFVLKTPYTADITREYTEDIDIQYPFASEKDFSTSESGREDEELDVPMFYGVGMAYRFSDELTASIDIYRVEWDGFVYTHSDGTKTSLITGKPSDETEVDPTHKVSIGAEYIFITEKYIVPFRGGISYAPRPAEGSPDDYYGFSIGTGIAIKRFAFDVGYQYRFGNDVGNFKVTEDFEFSQDVTEHTMFASIILYL